MGSYCEWSSRRKPALGTAYDESANNNDGLFKDIYESGFDSRECFLRHLADNLADEPLVHRNELSHLDQRALGKTAGLLVSFAQEKIKFTEAAGYVAGYGRKDNVVRLPVESIRRDYQGWPLFDGGQVSKREWDNDHLSLFISHRNMSLQDYSRSQMSFLPASAEKCPQDEFSKAGEVPLRVWLGSWTAISVSHIRAVLTSYFFTSVKECTTSVNTCQARKIVLASKGADPVAHWRFDEGGGRAHERSSRRKPALDTARPFGRYSRVSVAPDNSLKAGFRRICDFFVTPAYAASKGADPVAHWRFDEGGGPTAYDESANNNDGTLTPGAGGSNTAAGQMWSRQGKIGSALECDGTDDYVNIASVTGLGTGASARSFSAWVYPRADATGNDIVDSGTTVNNQRFGLARSTGNVIYFAGQFNDITGTLVIPTNQWSFVAVTYDGTTVSLYVNGIRDPASTTKTLNTVSTHVRIGNVTNGGEYFNGFIDDVRIYSYARTAEQILVDYNAGSAAHLGAGTDPNEGNPPVGYWTLDENTGQTAYDRSGSGNNGTLGSTSGSDANDPSWTQGKNGPALSFDGGNDYVSIPYSTSLSTGGSNAVTVSAWIYWTGGTHGDGLYTIVYAQKGSDPWQLYSLFVNFSDSKATFGVAPDGPGGAYVYSSTALSQNTWYYLAGTWNGTTLSIYVNGILSNSSTPATSLGTTFQTLYLGTNTPTNNLFGGLIDDIRIYNYARTAAQIAYDYSRGAPVAHYKFDEGGGAIAHNEYSTADTGAAPVSWWRMDEGTGQSASDSSGNANTGTLGATSGAEASDPTWSSSSKIGPYGLSFDGTDDYVDAGNAAAISGLGTTQYTLSVWVYPTSVTSVKSIVRKDSDYNLFLNSGYLKAEAFKNNTIYAAQGGTLLTINNWYFVTATWNISTGVIKLYVNGGLETSTTTSNSFSMGSYNLFIGKSSPYNEPFAGRIDDVRIYNYARSAEQIYNDYKTTQGTLVGDTKFTDGKIGKALTFDGTGDYVNVPDSDSLDVTTNLTVGAWVKLNASPTNYPTIVCKPDSDDWSPNPDYADYDLRVFTDAPNAGKFEFFLNDYVNTRTYSTTIPSVGTWYYVAATYDNSDVKMYVNGVLENTRNVGAGKSRASTLSLGIGARTPPSAISEYWNGLIDDIRIYNYARSSEQVMQDYNAGAAAHLGAQSAGEADPWGGALPVAHWKLDENTGVLARDASGSGNNGTLTNGPTWTQGKVGPALSFDGIDDYVNIPASASINGLTDFTFSLWAKFNNDSSTNGLMIDDANTGNLFQLIRYQSNPRYYNGIGYQSSTIISASSGWNHFVYTRSGTTLKIYINGILDSTFTVSSAALPSSGFDIGRYHDTNNPQYNLTGSEDDVRIYNYARSAAQVAWDYNRGKPAGHWRFNEGSGSTTYDESDNNNDGTITIGATGSQTTVAAAWTNGATGKFGKCMSFDGTDDYVSVTEGSSISGLGTQTFTQEAWIYPTSVPPSGVISIIRNDHDYNMFILNGKLKAEAFKSNTIYYEAGNITLSANTWYHLATAWDGSDFKLYVNGVLDSATTVSGAFTVSSNPLWIGRSSPYNEPFPGLIDDVRIYNYARTSEQVLQDYNAGAAARLGD